MRSVVLFNKMRPDDPVFNIKLVGAIEKKPCIWNWNMAEYSKKDFVEYAWIDIAREMSESVGNCRHRWKIIREGFARERRHVRSGNNRISTSKKPYYLAKYLDYLIPFSRKGSEIKKQNLSSSSTKPHTVIECLVNENVDQFESDVDIQEVDSIIPVKPMETRYEKFRQKGNKSFTTTATITSATKDPSPKQSKSAPMKRKLSTTAKSVETDCNEQQVKTKPDKIPDIDGNQLFMDSILPDLQNMTRKQNRKFRQKILALIDEILENDADRRFRDKFIALVNDVVDDGDNHLRQKVISLIDGILDDIDASQAEG